MGKIQTPDDTPKRNKNQLQYYQRHKKQILAKLKKLAKNPEWRKHRAQIALKSYYKRKEEKNARPENQI
jgi:tripartite-type tricarboxylate transporter receptor subunit TctC